MKITKEELNQIIMETVYDMLHDGHAGLIDYMMRNEDNLEVVKESRNTFGSDNYEKIRWDWVAKTMAVIQEELGIDPMEQAPDLLTEETIELLKLGDILTEGADQDAVRELVLFIENDAQIYRSRIQPIIKNLARKMAKGQYDEKLAIKGWLYAVDDGAKKYAKEFDEAGNWSNLFNKSTRLAAAQELRDRFYDEVEEMAQEFGMSR